ncbi:hypothetical protein Y695_00373 [Hydrogenophaga sp. T4]|uniref:hypothetical protein n=1 Tax=Hydrogenophaga sp. TaxID=1904254 RepID=UPI0003F3D2F4|nr:hypothetical protein [Hydrogenophaga sp.]EWS66366.1 hypothetical protein Y695_00373 [Hydrogenophaga sp. T4]MBT9549285.1 hypothetical protein [Hydrogenophaga sp.]
MALNLPITISTYVQERPVFKNRRQRRAKVVRPDFTPVSWGGRIAGQAVDAPTALPTLPSFPSPVEEGVDALRLADSSLTQAILLDWLGQQPIAFHRIYVDISGSVTAAVWLSLVLSRMSGISSEQIGATGIHNFTLARTQCEAETGLTESEQRKAHRQLVKAGVLSVSYSKKNETHPSRTPSPTFKLDLRKLTALLLARSEGLAEMVRHSAALAPTLDVQALERQAQARSMRRRA